MTTAAPRSTTPPPTRAWLFLAGLLAGGPPDRRPVFADTQPAVFRAADDAPAGADDRRRDGRRGR